MNILLKDIKLGERYVYLDGWVLPTTLESVQGEGWYSRHDLDFVPHLLALSGDHPEQEVLESVDYWKSTRIENEAT